MLVFHSAQLYVAAISASLVGLSLYGVIKRIRAQQSRNADLENLAHRIPDAMNEMNHPFYPTAAAAHIETVAMPNITAKTEADRTLAEILSAA